MSIRAYRAKNEFAVFKLLPGVARFGAPTMGGARAKGGTRFNVFLRQSDIDGACGQHCALMALLGLRVFSRGMLQDGGRSNWHALRVLARGKKYHFSGTEAATLKWLLAPLSPRIASQPLKGRHTEVSDFALDQLSRQRYVVLGIANSRAQFLHWVLAVGLAGGERKGEFTPEAVLVLDPQGAPPGPVPWNALVTLNANTPRGRLRWMVEHSGASYSVALTNALAIWREG